MTLRECGPCSACCTAIGVPELDKPPYRPCAHLCEAGCGVYADRPGSCRTFECQWLRGELEVDGAVDPDLRPDACGVMFDYQPDSAFGEVYTAWEVEAGASAREPAKGVLDGLAEGFLVLLVTPDPASGAGPGARRFLGPPHRVRGAEDVLWSGGGEP